MREKWHYIKKQVLLLKLGYKIVVLYMLCGAKKKGNRAVNVSSLSF